MNKLTFLLAAIMLSASPATWAHEDHDHQPAVEAAPHGGILRNAHPYKAELILEKDNAKVFVYDKAVKPVDPKRLAKTIKAQLSFPKDKKKKDVTFELKDDAYVAKLSGIDKVHRYDLHIILSVDGKSLLADFGVDNIH